MSKIMIALYMNLLPSLGLHGQGYDYGMEGQSHDRGVSSGQLENYDPPPDPGFAQPGNPSLLIKNQCGNHNASTELNLSA